MTHQSYIIPCGLLLIGIGLTIRYCIGKRRFCRRSITGLPQFSSYWKALLIVFIESLINLLGAACVTAGLLLVLIAYF